MRTINYKDRIIKLIQEYGTHELLTAYLMRTYNVPLERVDEEIYMIDADLERMYEERLTDDDEEAEDG